MRFLTLLVISILLTVGSTSADEQITPTPAEQLKSGLVAMRSGDKGKAWEILFPLAQSGDVQSMFYLGEMMLRSPEYGDNLERAIKFFTVAAAKGHEGAKAMLPRVKSMLEQQTSGALPTIAGANGVPSQADIDSANAKLKKYKAEVLRFTDNIVESVDLPRIDILVFLERTDSTAERLYDVTQSLERRFGNKIRTKYVVVIRPDAWTPDSPPTGGSSLPPNGFTPDFKGNLAAQHGVKKLPSIVVLPPSGQARVVDDVSSLTSTITSML